MRGGSIDGDALYRDMVCVKCFMLIAEENGVARGWRLIATDVAVELETVTPSGRVWNDRTWMWDDPTEASETPSLADAVANAWKAVDREFGQLFVDEDGPVREVRDMDDAVERLTSNASEAERVREACAKVAESVAQIIRAAPGSSIHRALCEAGAAIRSLPIGGR